jgi:hypothetical protein
MFRAKTYVNRKNEHKLQISGDEADIRSLLKGEAQTKKEFEDAVKSALSTPAWDMDLED